MDDGFDIDEYNEGSVLGQIVFSLANDNHEEGFDFNENNAGDLRVDMQSVEANGNGEEGIDYEEDDDDLLSGSSGDLVTVMNGVVTSGNGDGANGGLKIREKASGHLNVTLTNIRLDRQLRLRCVRAREFGRQLGRSDRQGGGTQE